MAHKKKIANSMSSEHNSQATAKKAINTTIPNNYSLTSVEEAVLFLSDFFSPLVFACVRALCCCLA